MEDDFLRPKSEYTPFPFWFWNGDLSETEIERQLRDFRNKGIDGVVIHPRIGLADDIEYLGQKFFHYVRFAVKVATGLKMRVILYDEGMYPSGAANGQIVRSNSMLGAKGIYLIKASEFQVTHDYFQQIIMCYRKSQDQYLPITDQNTPIADDNEIYYLVWEDSMGTIRGIHFDEDDGQPNAPRAADLLDPNASKLFLKLTHDKYFDELKEYFGDTIVGFFTDEPDILGRNHRVGMVPYNKYLAEILDSQGIAKSELVKLFSVGNDNFKAQYQNMIYSQLRNSYYRPISSWCAAHHIFLGGHPAQSEDIGLLADFQVPGQDVVWRMVAPEKNLGITGKDSTMAKCSADEARHAGKRRNLNEVFGCCGYNDVQWSLTTDEMKWYLDWLFIRGVNLIIPHAFFYSLDGKRQEDRPPDVGPNNLWWSHFRYFSDFIKRVSFMMTDIVNQTNIAILAEKDHLPYSGLEAFYQNQIEFNYLEDRYLLENKFKIEDGHLVVGSQSYDCLIIAADYPEREKIKAILKGFTGIVYLDTQRTFLDILPRTKLVYNAEIAITGIHQENIRFTSIKKENQLFYGLSNEGEAAAELELQLDKKIKSIEIWDPWQGSIRKQMVSNGRVGIKVERRELIFIKPSLIELTESPEKLEENTFIQVVISATDPRIRCGHSWTEVAELASYSGTIIYNLEMKTTSQTKLTTQRVKLNLGKVKNIATLIIDGKELETKFWAPYCFELPMTTLMSQHIQIAVTNTLSNQRDHVSLPSGLFGPVTVSTIDNTAIKVQ